MKQTIYLILFASFFGNWLTPVASAKTYSGRLEKSANQIYLNKAGIRYELLFSDDSFQTTLQKLKTKDFISVEGDLVSNNIIRNKPNKLNVSDVNYIGLNDLLGFWLDQNGYCYYFSGFTTLKTFYPSNGLKCDINSFLKLKFISTYNYIINPGDNGPVWSVLFSNSSEQYLGDLSAMTDSKGFRLILYRSQDGTLLSENLLDRPLP